MQKAGQYGKQVVVHVEPDEATLKRGQDRFNIYCAPCHDRTGSGRGMVVRRGYQPFVKLVRPELGLLPQVRDPLAGLSGRGPAPGRPGAGCAGTS